MLLKYKIYGVLHKYARKALGKDHSKKYRFVNFKVGSEIENNIVTEKAISDCAFINDIYGPNTMMAKDVFPVENVVPAYSRYHFSPSFKRHYLYSKNTTIKIDEAARYWEKFIYNSTIPEPYRYKNLHYGGFIKECNQWCLPSWIWTNAAIVKYLCHTKDSEMAIRLGRLILQEQQPCGGWIVRFDYSEKGALPILAPNDSAYIATNCCLELYDSTKDSIYLDSAVCTANWIMRTALEDGTVLFGFDVTDEKWIKDRNIVDIGFTGALFARLYEITKQEIYLEFLKRFVNRFVDSFYIPEKHIFATAIDCNGIQHGGAFGRGQAWALEGLIPAYKVLRIDKLKTIIDDTIESLLTKQNKDGSWSYNLENSLMGEDCKAVSVIASSLLDWFEETGNTRLLDSINLAMAWCINHTESSGKGIGGIFAYSIEGAMVHNKYTSTAMVYSSAYALSIKNRIEQYTNHR